MLHNQMEVLDMPFALPTSSVCLCACVTALEPSSSFCWGGGRVAQPDGSHCVGHAVCAANQLRSRAVTLTCFYSVFGSAFMGKKHARHEHRRAVALSLRGPSRAQRAFVSPNPHFVATLKEA